MVLAGAGFEPAAVKYRWVLTPRLPASASDIAIFKQFVDIIGAPEGIRTPGLCLRRAALYPAELRVRASAPPEAARAGYRIFAQRGIAFSKAPPETRPPSLRGKRRVDGLGREIAQIPFLDFLDRHDDEHIGRAEFRIDHRPAAKFCADAPIAFDEGRQRPN